MGSYQSHATSNPCSVAQFAGVEALMGPQDEIRKMREEFNERRKLMVKLVNAIDGLSCVTPMGAFYVMMNISKLKGRRLEGKGDQRVGGFCGKIAGEEADGGHSGRSLRRRRFCAPLLCGLT